MPASTTRNGTCIGLTRGDEMLVVRTHRHPDVWQPIGGGVSAGETPTEAAVREIAEETDWVVDPEALTEVLEMPMDTHMGTLVFYTAEAPESDPVIDCGEMAEYRWVSSKELLTLPAFPAARHFFQMGSLG